MSAIRTLILSPVPESGASARFRVYQYLPALAAAGFDVEVSPFFTPEFFDILYRHGAHARKARLFVRQFVRRVTLARRRRDYDLIVVHRESIPVGPAWMERVLAAGRGRAVVYDFDDAVYLPNVSDANRLLGSLKWPRKVPGILARSDAVIAGNRYIGEYARRYNPDVTVVPTAVDTTRFRPLEEPEPHGDPVVGWVGSPTTTRYLSSIATPLARAAATRGFVLRVAGAAGPVAIPGVHVENRPWSLATEVALFNTCDVGVYPLTDDPWTRGKCGFKAIQFMACGIPVVAAPVGVNAEIIQDGVNGFLAATADEWVEKLAWLLADAPLREKLGQAGRRTVEERYSVDVQAPRLVATLRAAVEKARRS